MLPLLRSWDVPWQLSPSGPGLRLHQAEDPGECYVTGYGGFGPLADMFPEEPRGLAHHCIRVDFIHGRWSRFCPAYAERETIREADYDWSQVPFHGPVLDIEAYQREFPKAWRENKRCPRSGAYEVLGSRWLTETGAAKWGYRHFLLVGREVYVEVLAKDWKWSVGTVTSESW